MDRLKNCPFCGGEAAIREFDDGSGGIRCSRCDCSLTGEETRKHDTCRDWKEGNLALLEQRKKIGLIKTA